MTTPRITSDTPDRETAYWRAAHVVHMNDRTKDNPDAE